MKIHEVINKLLNSRGISQKELSKKIGKSQTAVSQLLSGKYNFSESTLIKISDVLEIPVPILQFLALDESDIPEHKKELYRMLNPSMKRFLDEIFNLN